jgi:peptidoglycan hydrolase-like protein with peptidoglycan-binding domain
MPIYSSIGIRASVGRNGRNETNDVSAVQKRLNDLMKAPRVKLMVDGRSGPKTESMIADFQKVVLGTSMPDGRVDPNGTTIRALNDAASEGKWARMSMGPSIGGPGPFPGLSYNTPNSGGSRGQQLLQEAAAAQNTGISFDEIRRNLIDTGFPPFKSFIGSISKAEEARNVIAVWKSIRSFGFSPTEAARVYSELAKWEPSKTKAFFDAAAKPGSKLGATLAKLAKFADKVNLAIVLVEVTDKMAQGDYLYGTAELYKQFMGKAIPWAGLVESLQSIVEGVLPASAKNSDVFKVLRACDPVGIGAVGIDTVGTLAIGLVEMVVSGQMDTMRLDRLVSRMKSGPTAFFAELGENLGASIYEMSLWKSDDWSFAVKCIPGFIEETVFGAIKFPRPGQIR